MATPDELRAAIAEGREELRNAIREAGAKWEQKPAAGEGEEAWSPRQAAEHAISADLFFASHICVCCGYPGLDLQQLSFATPEEALAGFDEVIEKADGRLKYVTEKDLAAKSERFNTDVAGVMGVNAHHLKDHAAQIRND